MHENEPKGLDAQITALAPEVEEKLRTKLQEALRILRKAESSDAVILIMSPIGLMLMDLLFTSAGKEMPSGHIFYNCLARASDGDKGMGIKGLEILPIELALYLNTVRLWSNKIDHNITSVTFTEEDAEFALRVCLRFLKWFYCDYQEQPHRLATIYSPVIITSDSQFRAIDFSDEFEDCERFTPRTWLFNEIDRLLLTDDSQRCLFLTGAPGVGKSSAITGWIVSHQIKTDQPFLIQVIAYHFFRYNKHDTLTSRAFVYSLVNQILQAQISGYIEALQEVNLDSVAQDAHTGTLFNLLIVKPLRKAQRPANTVCVIAVDAMDEAVDYEQRLKKEGQKHTDVIDIKSVCSIAKSLPSWVRIVFTSRMEGSVINMIPNKARIPLDMDNEHQWQDIYNYALHELKREYPVPPIEGQTFEEIAKLLKEKADGNFLYLSCILSDFDTMFGENDLPADLPQYFESYFAERVGEEGFASLREPLQILLAFNEPVSDELIAKVLDTDPDDVYQTFSRLGSFAPVDDEAKRRLMHKALADWLNASTDNRHTWALSVNKGKTAINRWLDEKLTDLDSPIQEIWLKGCIFNSSFTAQSLQMIAGNAHDLPTIKRVLTTLTKTSIVEAQGTIPNEQDSQLFSVNPYLRLRGIEKLQEFGLYDDLQQQWTTFIRDSLHTLGKQEFTNRAGRSNAVVEHLIESMDLGQLETIIQGGGEETLPLLIELLVRGRIGVIRKVVNLSEFRRSTEHFNAQKVIVQGLISYVTGDYRQTVELAENAMLKAEEKEEYWMKSVARSTYTLSRVLLDEDAGINLEFEIATAIADANQHFKAAPQAGLYWRGMANMQAGTAYWHIMRRTCSNLGGETLLPEYNKALKHYEAALQDFRLIHEDIFRAYALNSLGHLMRLNNDLKTSRDYYAEALDISVQNKNIRGQLGFAHGMAGWLGWIKEEEAFKHLMSTVESLYLTQWNTMIPPIRAEYNLLWQQWGDLPLIEAPPLEARTKAALLRESTLLKRTVKQARTEFNKLPSLLALKGPRT